MYIYKVGYSGYDYHPEWTYSHSIKYSYDDFKQIVKDCINEIAVDIIKDDIKQRYHEFIEFMNNDSYEDCDEDFNITRTDYEEAIDSFYNIEFWTEDLFGSKRFEQIMISKGFQQFEYQAVYILPDEDLTNPSKPTKRRRQYQRDYDFFLTIKEIYDRYYNQNPCPWNFDESQFKRKIID